MNVNLVFRLSLISLLVLVCPALRATGPETVCRLPEKVSETSGIELTGKNEIWTLNDSGGEAELYLCDTLGNLRRTVKINGAENHDWEDLAQDDAGNFYIGDMGNNNNDRDNLRIYKIPNPGATDAESVDAEKIKFTYDDQTEFPPGDDQLNYDCEAVIWFNRHLYLFTKSRTLPIKTNVYRLPDQAGEYVARKIGSFASGGTSTVETDLYSYWITSADISPDGSRLALLSHDRVWVFDNFTGDDFFGGNYKVFNLEFSTQKESICFIDNRSLYISDEYWSVFDTGRNLYRIILPSPGITGQKEINENKRFSFHPNPFHESLTIEGNGLNQCRVQIVGQQGHSYSLFQPAASRIELNLAALPNGLYFLKVNTKTDGYSQVEKLLKQ